ncbi:Lrp/AsnC family transcriptional regulator [Ferribacterium limneticum]|uniref:Lrp/AsnC family transcriptional regulator n=1 Tax=Ferribacterium limneticum TaxID=76259 RepID=UPI001CFB3DFC|nr:AsnC family transcriptional regulator [Ferribacterium limneticum]UCV20251.1 AsnC family transcriptional regulator [Ferribacterium limneticum]
MRELSTVDRKILAKLQGDFPICERPYAEAAEQIGISEEELLQRVQELLADKVLTRFGPMFQIEEMGGAFVLAALAAPEERYDEVTALVNELPAVAHNYRREHVLNMWFVLATETKAGIAEAIARIERDTGLAVYAFPKEREFFVEMKLEARL